MSANPPVLPNSMTPCCFHTNSFIRRQIASSFGIEAVPSECARMARSPDKIHDIPRAPCRRLRAGFFSSFSRSALYRSILTCASTRCRFERCT